jgi:hypothetical protein
MKNEEKGALLNDCKAIFGLVDGSGSNQLQKAQDAITRLTGIVQDLVEQIEIEN